MKKWTPATALYVYVFGMVTFAPAWTTIIKRAWYEGLSAPIAITVLLVAIPMLIFYTGFMNTSKALIAELLHLQSQNGGERKESQNE